MASLQPTSSVARIKINILEWENNSKYLSLGAIYLLTNHDNPIIVYTVAAVRSLFQYLGPR